MHAVCAGAACREFGIHGDAHLRRVADTHVGHAGGVGLMFARRLLCLRVCRAAANNSRSGCGHRRHRTGGAGVSLRVVGQDGKSFINVLEVMPIHAQGVRFTILTIKAICVPSVSPSMATIRAGVAGCSRMWCGRRSMTGKRMSAHCRGKLAVGSGSNLLNMLLVQPSRCRHGTCIHTPSIFGKTARKPCATKSPCGQDHVPLAVLVMMVLALRLPSIRDARAGSAPNLCRHHAWARILFPQPLVRPSRLLNDWRRCSVPFCDADFPRMAVVMMWWQERR